MARKLTKLHLEYLTSLWTTFLAMANLKMISVLAFALAIISMLGQVAVAMPALEARQATCKLKSRARIDF